MKPIIFDLHTPLDDDTITAQIRHSMSLRLPELFAAEPMTLNVVANGPSAINAPLDGPTLALNGALKSVFLKNGTLPTYWAACDPQALVADFLPDDPPREITYLVASKCHPSVFEKLAGHDVRLWHVGDYLPHGVPSACSVTLTMLNAFFMMGVRRFNVWGWDCCVADDGQHHAGESGGLSDIKTVTCGDRIFLSTAAWANEAQTALYLIRLYEFFRAEVNIFGPSMIQAIREQPSALAA